ncbi:cytokinin dehydrogenase 3-like [Silene latifolia]|uniref:cytokinin dehydrogenase 3-like n=1 Tax=Silene latifolia TaxID=37657 RepID=UPI003D77E0A8
MAKLTPSYLCYLIIQLISRLISIIGLKQRPWTNIILSSKLLAHEISNKLTFDDSSISMASIDFGMLVHTKPIAVFNPTSTQDIVSLIKLSYNSSLPFKVAARGRGHSCRGQAMVENGIVIDMTSLSKNSYNHINDKNRGNCGIRVSYDDCSGFYVDVCGGLLWIDLLHATLEHGLAPISWTDYLYLSVGGTLSNAGISGQAFRHGPQITNVYELDVVTGKGELVTCSKTINSELFNGVLGGLGQFGIITRARIKLEAAPKRVKWVRMLYDDFSTFARDQEHLISLYGDYNDELLSRVDGLDYVEGSIMHQFSPNNWRSSFFTPKDQTKITSLNTSNGIIYCLEVVKYYYDYNLSTHSDIDKELEGQLGDLNFIPEFIFTKEVSFVEFLNRVRRGELELQSKGLWDVPHPWLNIFIPRSRINDFSHVFTKIASKDSKVLGPILIYPLNRNKWDDNMSAIIPDEDVFYTVGLLHSSGFDDWQELEDKNKELLNYCDEHGIMIKQYLPHYNTLEEWKSHFGKKWRIFKERKALFDPKMILSPGQKVFNHLL